MPERDRFSRERTDRPAYANDFDEDFKFEAMLGKKDEPKKKEKAVGTQSQQKPSLSSRVLQR